MIATYLAFIFIAWGIATYFLGWWLRGRVHTPSASTRHPDDELTWDEDRVAFVPTTTEGNRHSVAIPVINPGETWIIDADGAQLEGSALPREDPDDE